MAPKKGVAATPAAPTTATKSKTSQEGPGRIDIPTKGDKVAQSGKPSPGIALTQQFDGEDGYASNPLKASAATSTHRPKMHKRSGGFIRYT